ncbi:hypothetical protein AVEN_177006-1 [Araneus ventricosus]|uniref:Uncharacterized protein n=1 Tax=Araneus ventricosus TaxID=182803 RepID=A0A4Y2PMJ5_ARAVE|nr:hypothetical protein AVEN_177006-1 [Araneus ventricosus]
MAKALEPAAEDASVTIDADVVMVKNMQKVVMKMQYTVSRTKESPNTSGLSIRYKEPQIPSVLYRVVMKTRGPSSSSILLAIDLMAE